MQSYACATAALALMFIMTRLTLPRKLRLVHDLEFKAVYDARVRKVSGALAVSCRPNGLPHHRLGLSVGKPVGSAVVRTRCKRLVREAFRLMQHELVMHEPPPQATQGEANQPKPSPPCGFDIVVQVRNPDLGGVEGVKQSLDALLARCAKEWAKRSSLI